MGDVLKFKKPNTTTAPTTPHSPSSAGNWIEGVPTIDGGTTRYRFFVKEFSEPGHTGTLSPFPKDCYLRTTDKHKQEAEIAAALLGYKISI